MTTRIPFTEAALARAVRGAQRAGLRVTATSIKPDGTITIHHEPVAPPATEVKSKWDADPWTQNDAPAAPAAPVRKVDRRVAEILAGDPAEMLEAWKRSREEWPARVRAQPLNRLETHVFQILGAGEVGARPDGIKGAGPNTMERLAVRGFVRPIERGDGRGPDYELTQAGKEEWTRLQTK
jgi:hypothetical protein